MYQLIALVVTRDGGFLILKAPDKAVRTAPTGAVRHNPPLPLPVEPLTGCHMSPGGFFLGSAPLQEGVLPA